MKILSGIARLRVSDVLPRAYRGQQLRSVERLPIDFQFDGNTRLESTYDRPRGEDCPRVTLRLTIIRGRYRELQ